MNFSQRSLKNLEGVHPDLVKVAHKALEYAVVDFVVTDGVRTLEQQAELYAIGRTKPGKIVTWTMKSNHLPKEDGYGYAVDCHPYPISFDDLKRYEILADTMSRAAEELNIKIICGRDWHKQDMPHFELMEKIS